MGWVGDGLGGWFLLRLGIFLSKSIFHPEIIIREGFRQFEIVINELKYVILEDPMTSRAKIQPCLNNISQCFIKLKKFKKDSGI